MHSERQMVRGGRYQEISSPLGRVARQEGIFEHNLDRPPLHTFFDEALCMNIGIPRLFGVSIAVIIAKRRTKPLRGGPCQLSFPWLK
jgi:hypothetical protein